MACLLWVRYGNDVDNVPFPINLVLIDLLQNLIDTTDPQAQMDLLFVNRSVHDVTFNLTLPLEEQFADLLPGGIPQFGLLDNTTQDEARARGKDVMLTGLLDQSNIGKMLTVFGQTFSKDTGLEKLFEVPVPVYPARMSLFGIKTLEAGFNQTVEFYNVLVKRPVTFAWQRITEMSGLNVYEYERAERVLQSAELGLMRTRL